MFILVLLEFAVIMCCMCAELMNMERPQVFLRDFFRCAFILIFTWTQILRGTGRPDMLHTTYNNRVCAMPGTETEVVRGRR